MTYTLQDIADALDNAKRMGTARDEPEGARYIQLSDSAAQDIADSLRSIDLQQRMTTARNRAH